MSKKKKFSKMFNFYNCKTIASYFFITFGASTTLKIEVKASVTYFTNV